MSACKIAIVWKNVPAKGTLAVINGTMASAKIVEGTGCWSGKGFEFKNKGPGRIECQVRDARLATGSRATRITVATTAATFTFFVRDVQTANPILIAIFGAAVIPANDRRTYAEVDAQVRAMGLSGIQQQIDAEPEESFARVCKVNRNEKCPTWLGLGRDMRFFEVGHHADSSYWGYVTPRYHSMFPTNKETKDASYFLNYAIGRGDACRHNLTRHLDEGYLPILHATQREDDMVYNLTAFAILEKSRLTPANLRGTEWDAAYAHTNGNMYKPEEREKLKDRIATETTGREEEVVLRIRIEAVNPGRVPSYAWFKAPGCNGMGQWIPTTTLFDETRGFCHFESGRVYAIVKCDGKPATDEEMAVLVKPGGRVVVDLLIPHQPLPAVRAIALAGRDYDADLEACRAFWHSKLSAGASISVPEPAIDERIKAGQIHCDIAALGREPDGPVLATIGWYGPIGSESSPIIQFFDSMGWHKLAERSLEFFLARQRDDGFIQNFAGYQLETGPALWTMGEHFRYTRDIAWVRRIKPKLIKACDYLLAWRERNKKPELRGQGYGLIDGKVGDPEDFFRSFMLNGVTYLGLQRVTEMLAVVDPAASRRLAKEVRAYREDIRASFYESMGKSPVIPLSDGTWIPTLPPWAEYAGPLALYADGGKWFTHGAFGARDCLTGALYLVFCEILTPTEIGAEIALKCHQHLFTVSNANLTQPYYARNDYAHLMRGEVKAFLKTYYNQFSALQDRETYTFWEHYCHASQHKTHEEGWFLMQTRWMLWIEDGSTLRLMSGIPRAWMMDGKRIELNKVASHFGPLTVSVISQLKKRQITAHIAIPAARKPESILIRLPHPDGLKAVRVTGGAYDPSTETVTIKSFRGKATVALEF